MTQRSLFWDGSVLGDCGPYTQAHIQDQFFRCVMNGTGNRGVVKGWQNELEVTGLSSPVSIDTGGAVVYGGFYDLDAATTLSVTTPASGLSRYDRVVARRDWAAQTIRVARVVGTAGVAPAVPALTQAAGAIWEIPLATLLVTDAGSITVTDTREFCALPSEWAAGIVAAGMYVAGAVTAAKRPDRTRYIFRGAGEFQPNSANPCTWTAGGSYNYWAFADGATNRGWAYFQVPDGVTANPDFYVWSVPDVNGAGGGVENCQWDYQIYSASVAIPTPVSTAGTTNVDQQARLNTTLYADLIVTGLAVAVGDVIAFRLSRDGAADSYNSAMRFIGLEMRYTADA